MSASVVNMTDDNGTRAVAATITAEGFEYFLVDFETEAGDHVQVHCVDLADAIELVDQMQPPIIHVEADDDKLRALVSAALRIRAGDDVAMPSSLH